MEMSVIKKVLPCVAMSVILAFTTLAGNTSASSILNETEFTENEYSSYTFNEQTYSYDFTDTEITTYSNDEALSTANLRTNMVFENGRIYCLDGETYTFGSKIFLGDDYGLKGGTLEFTVSLGTKGAFYAGLREQKTSASPDLSGVWFKFTNTEITIYAQSHEITQQPAMTLSYPDGTFADELHIKLTDDGDKITLNINGTDTASVEADEYTDTVIITNIAANETVSGICEINMAGFFSIYAENTDGWLDDVKFTHTEVVIPEVLVPETTAIDYTTWTATDDRDRTTEVNTGDSTVNSDKQVGMFYFLCHTGSSSSTPKDITYLYRRLGADGLKEYLQNSKNKGSHYWAEPYYGYYTYTDAWVYRKHAYMLEDMGVDFIFVDITNGESYPEGIKVLFDTWLQIRKEGNETPQICFFCAGHMDADISSLRSLVYNDASWEKYSELFYYYEGKPLILGKTDNLSYDDYTFVKEKFTIRDCWAWQNSDGTWNWLQEYVNNSDGTVSLSNGGKGRDSLGNFEELALCVGHHPTTSKGRSYANGTYPESDGVYGFTLDSGSGLGLAESYKAIKALDPKFMLITGWNEWEAGLTHNANGNDFAGQDDEGFYMVDQFNTEYSRDSEPMKLRDSDEKLGFGDNYYYQLCSIIRDFKGIDTISKASGQKTIDLTDSSAWNEVGPVYQDTICDSNLRSAEGYFSGYQYVNSTARNDITNCKVSQDSSYIYFYIECRNDIICEDEQNFMNVFLDIDGSSDTGWEGYDIVLNRARDGHYVSVESLANGWEGGHIGKALYTVDGTHMVIRLSKSIIKVSGTLSSFKFKVADGSTVTGDVMEFMDLGDTAPNDRFSYCYMLGSGISTDEVQYTLFNSDGKEYTDTDETKVIDGFSQTEMEKLGGVSKGLIIGLCGGAAAIILAAVLIIIKFKKKKAS